MDNLQLRQRIVRSMIRVGERTNNMRKPEKFEYRKHMTAAFMDMLELCIEANRARGQRRVELQNKMDTKLDVLRSLVDTAVSPETCTRRWGREAAPDPAADPLAAAPAPDPFFTMSRAARTHRKQMPTLRRRDSKRLASRCS